MTVMTSTSTTSTGGSSPSKNSATTGALFVSALTLGEADFWSAFDFSVS
jgi:hypothetical protein